MILDRPTEEVGGGLTLRTVLPPTLLAALLLAAQAEDAVPDGRPTEGLLPTADDLRAVLADALRDALVGPLTEALQRAQLPRYLTVDQCAELAQCSRRTVDYWRQRGLLPYSKIGRRVVVQSADLLALLDEQGRIPALEAIGPSGLTSVDSGAP